MNGEKDISTLWSGIHNTIMPKNIQESDSLLYWRTQILSIMLLAAVIMGFFVLIPVVFLAIEEQLWILLASDMLLLALALFLLIFPQIGFFLRAMASLSMIYGVGLLVIFNVGIISGGPAWLFCFAVLAGVLLGSRAAVIALLINTATYVFIGFLLSKASWGIFSPPFLPDKLLVSAGVNFLFLNALAAICVSVLVKGLTRSHEKEKQLTKRLKEKQLMLEAQIVEREQSKIALKESEEKYRTILGSIEDGYFEVDLHGNLIFFNTSLCRILGYTREELTGMNHIDFMDKANAAKIYKAFHEVYQTGVPTRAIDWQLIRKDGSKCFIEIVVSLICDADAKGVGFRGIARDVSHRKNLEQKLRQAYKMESIGTLAGGIAHDFNNVLSIILGNAEIAFDQIPEANPARDNFAMIKSASMRAADIVKQLLNFSRETEQKLNPLDLVSLVREELKFLRSTLPAFIEIRETLPDIYVPILGDSVQINQLLINICTNAAQAMEKEGGVLEISITPFALEAEDLLAHPDLESGKYVRLTIRDTGPGIAPENLDKIFDPYFTTKAVGKGSGMGLAVVHGIVKNHFGTIGVKSDLGKFTQFEILFPLTHEISEGTTHDTKASTPVRGSETILFVDDDAVVIRTTQSVLNYLGYRVETRSDPREALALFAERPGEFDLVITDMTMPRMTGASLAGEIMSIRPGIPVIICTGHSDLIDEETAKNMGISSFLMKPVTLEKMAKTIREVLDQT